MKTIEEKNRMIAEFMGVEFNKIGERFMASPTPNDIGSCWEEQLKYDSSWEWLMPVVGKCLEVCHEEMLNEWENSFADVFLSTSFDLMFKEVTQFIEWHNKNK